jgi:UrcA family protein
MKNTSLLFALTLLGMAASPVIAAPFVVTGQRAIVDDAGRLVRVVSFRGLDIASADGERTLMRRVRGAVNSVCAPAGNFVAETSCRNYAWRGARPQLALALEQARTNPALASATLSTLTISAPPG